MKLSGVLSPVFLLVCCYDFVCEAPNCCLPNQALLTQQKSHKDTRSPGHALLIVLVKGQLDTCDVENAAHHLALKYKMYFLILNGLSTTKPALPVQSASSDLTYPCLCGGWGASGVGRG